MKLHLKILNLEGIYLEKEVDLLNITTENGEITILANHQPLITTIEISQMYIKENNVITRFCIAGGTLFVDEKCAKILTSAIESESEIDYARAQRALQRAQKRLEKQAKYDIKRAEIDIKKSLNRLSMKGKSS